MVVLRTGRYNLLIKRVFRNLLLWKTVFIYTLSVKIAREMLKSGEKMRIGIDLGGTKTEGILIDQHGETVHRFSRATPGNNYSAIIRNIVAIVDELKQIYADDTPPSIGIGIPGSVSLTTGLVKNANTTCLIGNPFHRDLETALKAPVRLANDADCFTLSEAIDGAAAGYNTVFGVIVGTGVVG